MALLFCLLPLLYLVNYIQPSESVGFHLPSPTTFVHSCTPQGSWAVEGNITVTEADMQIFSKNVTFKVQDKELCTIHLDACPMVSSSMTSPSTLSPEVCECLGRITDDDYTVYIRRALEPSDAGHVLTAVIPALPKFKPVQTTYEIGRLPAVTSGNMTYQVNDGMVTPLRSVQNITCCGNVPVELTVCASTAQPGTVLKLSEKGQTMSTPQTCVHIIEKFSFKDVDSYPVVFTYDEGAGCPFQEHFIFNVYNDQQTCVGLTPTTVSPAFYSTTPTTTAITRSPTPTAYPQSCRKTSTSLARQTTTLSDGLRVLCDTETDGGDWIIIQRRTRGDVDFYRKFAEYVAGFGNITGDFWMGLQDIHTICPPSKPCTLRVDIKDDQYNSGHLLSAQYTNFSLTGYTDQYRITVGKYNGTAGDALSRHTNIQFSTFDRENGPHAKVHCATLAHGGWWYDSCSDANLNGLWGKHGEGGYYDGLQWYNTLVSPKINMYATYSEMKVRM